MPVSNELIRLLGQGYDPAARESQLLDLQAQRAAVGQIPEDIDYLRERRRQQLSQADLHEQERTLRIKALQSGDARDKLDYLMKVGPHLNLSNYTASKNFLEGNNLVPPGSMPPINFFKNGEHFEQWKNDVGIQLKAQRIKLDYKPSETGEYVGLPESVEPGQEVSPVLTGIKAPPKESKQEKYTSHIQTDDRGNQVNVVTDELGNVVKVAPIGPYGQSKTKPQEHTSDFDKKWALAGRIAKEQAGGREPSQAEIADTYKAKFGAASLLMDLLGMQGGGASPSAPAKPPVNFK